MSHSWPFTAQTIAARLALIAPYVNRRRIVLPHFHILPLHGAIVDAPICSDPTHWDEIEHNSYWGHADLNFVMKSAFAVPPDWNADEIALHLPLGALGDIFNHPEALVHVDTAPIGSADRYHHTIALSPDMADGKSHMLSLHGWTGLAGWPPDPTNKSKLYMGEPALVQRDPVVLAFVRLAQTMLDTASTLGCDTAKGRVLIDVLNAALQILDTRAPIGDAFYASAPAALAYLEQNIATAGDPLDVTLHGIGHAHMDIAYLWPIDQIRLKNARTYSNVLRLMDDDPDYLFSHSQPQLYAYTQTDYPAIFEQIKTRVAQGRWEVMGGMWVEPDMNLPGSESLIRQLTLGRGYFKETFGDVETPALWLPDTFGFPAQTPQLMRLAGLKWFVTNKLNWNQYNKVPSTTHHWDGLDGSRVLAHVLTTPRDVQYLPFPTNYKSDLSGAEVLGTWTNSSAQEQVRDLPICYGYGDGGGGPTEDLLAKARVFAAMPGMPRLKHSTVRATLEAIEQNSQDLPVWQGEHYMEGHRGTYTSQGWIKRANRKAEWALHEAEAMAAMAGQSPDLTEAWQLLCLNQFHDIITGTSIGDVFEDARRDYARIRQIAEKAAQTAAGAIALPTRSIVNTSPTSGPRLAEHDGELFYFDALPSYSITPISAATQPKGTATYHQDGDTHILENPFVRVVINAAGQIVQLTDTTTGHEILTEDQVGNELLAFEDRPIAWDAWDVDPTYENRCDVVAGPTAIEVTENGPLWVAITITIKWQSSEIRQTIRLAAHSKRLDFITDVDWHERHTLLKASFPTALSPTSADYDTQWGRIARATTRDTPFDAARFEVPAHKWASITDGDRAVALLNDCKYGYDVLGGRMRITLIKCATSPDPQADQGHHQFTYALLPYDPAQPATLDHEAYDLNAPLRCIAAGEGRTAQTFVQSSAANIIIETLKPSKDGQGVILRLFDADGAGGEATLTFAAPLTSVSDVSIFEDTIAPLDHGEKTVTLSLEPFQIRTLRVVLST